MYIHHYSTKNDLQLILDYVFNNLNFKACIYQANKDRNIKFYSDFKTLDHEYKIGESKNGTPFDLQILLFENEEDINLIKTDNEYWQIDTQNSPAIELSCGGAYNNLIVSGRCTTFNFNKKVQSVELFKKIQKAFKQYYKEFNGSYIGPEVYELHMNGLVYLAYTATTPPQNYLFLPGNKTKPLMPTESKSKIKFLDSKTGKYIDL